MRTIAIRTLRECWQQPTDVEQPLRAWYANAKRSVWKSPADVKTSYRNASIVSADRVVFNIKGNDYRLVVAIDYSYEVVYVRFVGTHRDYDRIDAKTI